MIRMRNGFAIAVLLALLGLCGCSLFTITIDDSDAGSIQRMDVGDLLVIRLLGNASTGYEWVRVEPASLAGSPLEIVKESNYLTLECQMVGEPVEFVFRYRAMHPGTVSLVFEHRRPWDPDDPIDTYSVMIRVH